MRRREFLAATAAIAAGPRLGGARAERRLLYVAAPGIRNYQSYGGVGVLVYDVSAGYTFVRRIPTWDLVPGQDPENVKGVAASAITGRLYVSTIRRVGCIDLLTDRMLWSKELEGGVDRLALAPDGKTIYAPSFEGPHWNVVDAITGTTIKKLVTSAGAHNTLYALDGREVYLAGLRSSVLTVADPRTHTVTRTVGPFTASVRPFTVNGSRTRCYVNCNDLLGFEIGDLRTGAKLRRVVVDGYATGPVDRHGCPSHGVALTPDESEIWISDGHNRALHIFDNRQDPPRQVATIPVRDQPGWISFNLDGTRAYPSTGEIFDTKTRQRVAALSDETGRNVASEKLVEIAFEGTKPVRVTDQFGIGQRRQAS